MHFSTQNKIQNNYLPGTTYFGALKQLMTLIICGFEYGAIFGRSIENFCSGMHGTLVLHQKLVNLPAVS